MTARDRRHAAKRAPRHDGLEQGAELVLFLAALFGGVYALRVFFGP